MALITLRQLLDHTVEHGYGVPAFNVNNLEQMRAIMEAAYETSSPVIVQASAGAVRKFLTKNKKEFDPRKWLAASTKSMKEICKSRYELLGRAGRASKIKPLSLQAMVKRYDKGELDRKVN